MSNLSPTPGTPQTKTKAIVGTALTVVTTFASLWIVDTDPFTAKEAVASGIAALVSAGLVGGVVAGVKNKAL